MKTHIFILAAGSSSRMGSPKQLIDWNGKPLLRHLAKQAIATAVPVSVILGANCEIIRLCLDDLPVTVIENADWSEGMSSSIRLAARSTTADAVLLMVCDQPMVGTSLLQRMMDVFEGGNPSIIACEYAGTFGVPALFSRALFDELLKLEGQQGAKAVIQRHRDDTFAIPFDDGVLDLDTPEDVKRVGG